MKADSSLDFFQNYRERSLARLKRNAGTTIYKGVSKNTNSLIDQDQPRASDFERNPFSAFEEWRHQARLYLQQSIPPDQAQWQHFQQSSLFNTLPGDAKTFAKAGTKTIFIPKEFLSLARIISCHRGVERWSLLYLALWRIVHGERHLLKLYTNPVMHRLFLMEKAVRRDAHKTKAFVRFRCVHDEEGEHYIAWHRSDHFILPIVAPFFQRRFEVMRWTIITVDASVHWNGKELLWTSGMPQESAPTEDNFEIFWLTYYRAIFNPARIKLKMMRQEMPVRYWQTMPETKIIPDLLAEAPSRVEKMIAQTEGFSRSALDFMPAIGSLSSLRDASKHCQGCPLYQNTTCTVFGAGPENASMMIVGEQPGDEEDKNSQPFIGPAGQLLNQAFTAANVNREKIYITNAVKHFKHQRNGNQRLHKTPNNREIEACRPWLKAEIEAVKPKVILLLGVTAGRSLFGPSFALKAARGIWHQGPENTLLRVSYHPAAILRTLDPIIKKQLHEELIQDLRISIHKGQTLTEISA